MESTPIAIDSELSASPIDAGATSLRRRVFNLAWPVIS
jgi:hypothetical protein